MKAMRRHLDTGSLKSPISTRLARGVGLGDTDGLGGDGRRAGLPARVGCPADPEHPPAPRNTAMRTAILAFLMAPRPSRIGGPRSSDNSPASSSSFGPR